MSETIGTVVAFAGPRVPKGYLACDGGWYKRTDKQYKALFDAIGTTWGGDGATMFRVPDLRGVFLRGVSGDSGRDPDADSRVPMFPGDINPGNKGNAVGSYQADQVVRHNHNIPRPEASDGNRSGQQDAWYGNNPANDYTEFFGGNETRPRNVNVHWIIRYA